MFIYWLRIRIFELSVKIKMRGGGQEEEDVKSEGGK